jgi:hypothetical protein
MNTPRLAGGLRRLPFSIAMLASLAAHAARAEPAALPERTPAQIRAEVDRVLKDMGDLKEYIHHVDNGSITVLTFSMHPGCATLPEPTILHHSVDEAKLQQLERALEVVNQNLADGADPVLQGSQAACIDPLRRTGRLPELAPEEIKAKLKTTLQRLGNLAAYFEDPGANGSIVIKSFSHRHKCATLPKPLAVGQGFERDRFWPVENALEKVNRADAETPQRSARFIGRRAHCLNTPPQAPVPGT